MEQSTSASFIAPATAQDAGRIAEILVFNNRLNFFPIFKDEQYSFCEMQVMPLARQLARDLDALARTFVWNDGVLRGFVRVQGREVEKLFVDPCFQGQGVGSALLRFAVTHFEADHLWALESNEDARRFYAVHGFVPTGESRFEEGTDQRLLLLRRQT